MGVKNTFMDRGNVPWATPGTVPCPSCAQLSHWEKQKVPNYPRVEIHSARLQLMQPREEDAAPVGSEGTTRMVQRGWCLHIHA